MNSPVRAIVWGALVGFVVLVGISVWQVRVVGFDWDQSEEQKARRREYPMVRAAVIGGAVAGVVGGGIVGVVVWVGRRRV